MKLETQIAIFLGSVVIAMCGSFLWTLFHRLFLCAKIKWVRILFETIFFSIFFYVYYMFLVEICDGILNIQEGVAIFIGVWLYQKFYLSYVWEWFDRKIQKIQIRTKKLKNKINIVLAKIFPKRYNNKKERRLKNEKRKPFKKKRCNA